jgi:hypothetical protein
MCPDFKEKNGDDRRLNLIIRSEKQLDLTLGAELFCNLPIYLFA